MAKRGFSILEEGGLLEKISCQKSLQEANLHIFIIFLHVCCRKHAFCQEIASTAVDQQLRMVDVTMNPKNFVPTAAGQLQVESRLKPLYW